ncbi:MAG: SlyX family protein [Bacteriovorax sp.]|nr:SlyX family protein [Bacteriovorax sp.]
MLEARLINLEMNFSHQESLLEQLNEIVTAQQRSIDMLEKEMLELKLSLSGDNTSSQRSLADDIPPHY